MDFANKFLGGGVLNSGCVQEEIRFVICPELLLSLLFTEKLESNECLIIKGSEQYSSYSGYGDSFKFEMDYQDDTGFDNWNRKDVEVVAIDALSFRFPKSQFSEAKVIRELKKAYCGFYLKKGIHTCSTLATGNWGCGAFRGDRQLKC
jgi:poly(ADP-ribose) glycohydrolase